MVSEASESNLKIGIIVSRFNEFITNLLLEGAKRRLEERRASYEIFYVPGAFEIPVVAKILAERFDALIALGCIIRGETHHFEAVVDGVVRGVVEAALNKEKPVIFGVLTVDSIEQAIDRAGGKLGNKGYEFADNALYMAELCRRIKDKDKR